MYVFTPYINESNIQFPSCVSSLQVPSNVDVIVSDDPSDQIRRGDAFSPLGGHKHPWCWNINTLLKWQRSGLIEMGQSADVGKSTCFLNVFVNILWSSGCVRNVVVGHKVDLQMWKCQVQTSSQPDYWFFFFIALLSGGQLCSVRVTSDLVFLEELCGEGPGGVTQHLINIAAVPQSVVAFVFCHHRVAFILVGEFITADWLKPNRQEGSEERNSLDSDMQHDVFPTQWNSFF